jgi:hypothetical protein
VYVYAYTHSEALATCADVEHFCGAAARAKDAVFIVSSLREEPLLFLLLVESSKRSLAEQEDQKLKLNVAFHSYLIFIS